MKDLINICVVSAAAQNLNHETYDGLLIDRILANVFCSIKSHLPNTDILLLGAFGCGVFKNNPYTIAKAMQLACQKYGGLYKNIVFAIPKGPNVQEFKEVFGFHESLMIQIRKQI